MNITVTAPLTTSTMNIISRKLRTIHSTLNAVVHGDTPPGYIGRRLYCPGGNPCQGIVSEQYISPFQFIILYAINVQDEKVKGQVTRPINTDTHRVPYLPNGKVYELHTWYTDGGRRPASATGAMTSKVKDQGRKVTWWVWAVLSHAVFVSLRAGGGIPSRPNPAATLVFLLFSF